VNRLEVLLADRALVGLGDGEARELRRLLGGALTGDPLGLEHAAAAVDLALGPSRFEPVPDALRRRLVADAEAFFGRAPAPAGTVPPRTRAALTRAARWPAAPWWIAAAATLLALLGWWSALGGGAARPLDLGSQRSALLARAGVTRVEWAPTELAPGLQGDVVWAQAEQRGFLRFEGLPVNDPSIRQYQLWIFDEEQEHPIDGGVFDATSSGELLVPITPKLRVARPTLFAVTVEKPGGVVVSDQERIAALARI